MSVKLCKDCKHFLNDKKGFEKCNKKVGNDLVTGEPISNVIYCSSHRKFDWLGAILSNACGKSGRWFEPKEPSE